MKAARASLLCCFNNRCLWRWGVRMSTSLECHCLALIGQKYAMDGLASHHRSRDARASSSAAEWVATSISGRRLKRGIGQGDHHDIKCTLGCGSDLHVRGSGLQQDRTDRSTAGTRARHCRDSGTGRKRGYDSARLNNCIHHSLGRRAARLRGAARPTPKLP